MRATYPRKGLGWTGARAPGRWGAYSRSGPVPRVMIRCIERARELRLRELSPPVTERPAQEISVDWWCTMIRRASPEVAGAHTLDSSEAPPSQRTR